MSKKWFVVLIFLTVPALLQAQNASDVLRYNVEYPSSDAISLVMPAVSHPTGFGAYQENPAAMALTEEGYFSFSLSSRFMDETSSYLGNEANFSDNQTNIGDLGFAYKVPTTRGSLVIGGGYSQTTDFNRAFSGNGFNSQSTVTDFYANMPRSSDLNEAAFNAFAIEDVNTDSSVSIFRFGDDFSNYPGITQDVELTERGVMGEYSAFLATELLKGFSVGASIGFLNGTYALERDFLESDSDGNYDGEFIDADGDGNFETDIDRILSVDTIEADLQAFSARLGFVYQPIENINIGASYTFPSVIHIDENFNTRITTTFDNGGETGVESAPGTYSYKVNRPARFKTGLAFESVNVLTFSVSVEAVRYSQSRIEYEELEYSDQERDINNVVRSSLNDVINLRGGLEYEINEQFIPRIGYAFFPNPQDGVGSKRQFMSGGFSAELTKGLMFDLGLQYSFWEDQNILYETPNVSQAIEEDVGRLHVMAGIRMAL